MSLSTFHQPFFSFYDVDSLIEDALRRPTAAFGGTVLEKQNAPRALRPKMDLHENLDHKKFIATFDLPGLTKDQVNIDVTEDRLTVSGEVSEESERHEEGIIVRERGVGKFSRTIGLPAQTKPDEIHARMENGVLTVEFPKGPFEKIPRRVNID